MESMRLSQGVSRCASGFSTKRDTWCPTAAKKKDRSVKAAMASGVRPKERLTERRAGEVRANGNVPNTDSAQQPQLEQQGATLRRPQLLQQTEHAHAGDAAPPTAAATAGAAVAAGAIATVRMRARLRSLRRVRGSAGPCCHRRLAQLRLSGHHNAARRHDRKRGQPLQRDPRHAMSAPPNDSKSAWIGPLTVSLHKVASSTQASAKPGLSGL